MVFRMHYCGIGGLILFSGKDWRSFYSRNFWQSGNTLRIYTYVEGGMRLMRPLDYVYAIRFKIDYAKLEDFLTFPDCDIEGRRGGTFVLSMDTVKNAGEIDIEAFGIPSGKQPENTPGFHRVEMLQTSKIFRLYVDDELILYAPSFFLGGYFTILAQL